MDIIGEQQFDVEHTVLKRRLDMNGRLVAANEERETRLGGPDVPSIKSEKEKDPKYCGSCYGAEDEHRKCCNTCDQVREQYRKKGWAFTAADAMEQCVLEGFTEKLKAQVGEGCNVYGYIMVNKVAGNFHFAPGKSFQHSNMHVHDFMPFEMQGFNLSHIIHQLSFGELYPGLQNPLDEVAKIEPDGPRQFQYFLKVVPTVYNYRSGKSVRTNQFSVTESERRIDASGGRGLPGVFFMYDLSPIQVTHTEYRTSFGHFLTSLCAIVGGTFTVAGIIDSCVYHGIRNLRRKVELGKAS